MLPQNVTTVALTLLFGACVRSQVNCLASSVALHTGVPLIVLHNATVESHLVHGFQYTISIEELKARVVDGRRLYDWISYRHIYGYKFLAWTLIEYERILVLDSDTYLMSRVDHLFRVPMGNHFVAAAPACSDTTFNGGVLVVRPSIRVARQLAHATTRQRICEPRVTDQSIMNSVFRNKWVRLSSEYNFAAHAHAFRSEKALPNTIRIAHVVGEPKIDLCARFK